MESDGENVTVHTLYGDTVVKKSDAMGAKCATCKSKKHVVFDELIGDDGEVNDDGARFKQVEELESMTADERYEFWRNELSKCIRCNACRNVCPACSCEHCVFDNPESGIQQRAAVNSFEENMFHLIRAFHVAGAAPTAENARGYVPRIFLCTFSTENISRTLTNFTAIIRRGLTLRHVLPLMHTRSMTASRALFIKKEVMNNVQTSYRET